MDMRVAVQMLKVGLGVVLDSEAALCNTAAVASLASARTSLIKRAVQFLQAASSEQVQQAAAEANIKGATAAACFAALVPDLLGTCPGGQTGPMCHAARIVYDSRKASSTASSTGSGKSQAAASAALLAVVLARSIVQLADAMEAAGPQLLFDSVMAQPGFGSALTAASHVATDLGRIIALHVTELQPMGGQQQHSVLGQWQCWQLAVLHATGTLFGALNLLGLVLDMPASEVAADAAAATTATSAALTPARTGPTSSNEGHDAPITAADGSGNSSSGSSSSAAPSSSSSAPSSSSSQQVQWSYLLQVQPRLVAAVAATPSQAPSEAELDVLLHPFDAEAAWQAASSTGSGLQELPGTYAACVQGGGCCHAAACGVQQPGVPEPGCSE
jgi:hypothetical protein